MKPRSLSLAFCICLFARLHAQQGFSLNPNPVFGEDVDGFIVEGKATVKNLLDTVQNFRWKRTVLRLDHDSLCVTAVTDPFMHYFPAMSERDFFLQADQEGPLEVVLFDFEQTGCCAIVRMQVKSLDVPADSVEAYYYLRTCQPLSVLEMQKPAVQIFPNPAAQYFSLQNAEPVARLSLCDAGGKMLKRMSAKPENRYGIADLPMGAYYLVLENKEGNIIQVLEFVKR